MSDPTKRPGPLNGVRVLDFSMFLAGPYAGRLLADHGAEVIKIEPPGGETIRSAHPVVDGKSRYFAQLNAGKKCITLDLKSEEGKAAVRKLIVDSDVVLENFRPGVLDRLGLGYEFLNEINPRSSIVRFQVTARLARIRAGRPLRRLSMRMPVTT